jgi:hypothetical protein
MSCFVKNTPDALRELTDPPNLSFYAEKLILTQLSVDLVVIHFNDYSYDDSYAWVAYHKDICI